MNNDTIAEVIEVITAVVKGGRCFNGAHRDRGVVVHAMLGMPPNGDWFAKSLCGARPGNRSYGWSETKKQINCPKCLKQINKQTKPHQ